MIDGCVIKMASASCVEDVFEAYLTVLKKEIEMFLSGGNRKVEKFMINEFLNRYVVDGNLLELAELIFALEDPELFDLVMDIENAAFEHFEYSALEMCIDASLLLVQCRKWVALLHKWRYGDFDSVYDDYDDVGFSDSKLCYCKEKYAGVVSSLCAGRKAIEEEEGCEDIYYSGWM